MLVMTRQRIRLLQITEHCIGGSLMAKAASDQNTNTNTIGTVRNLMRTYTYLERAFIEQETYLDIEKKKKMKFARRMLSRKQLICRCTTHASDQLDKTAQVVYFTISPFFLYLSVFHFFLQLFSFSPELSDGPSLVYVNVFVRSFSKIDDVKMVKIDLISHVRF